MWLLLLALVARADMPLPSYEDELCRIAWHDVDKLLEQGRYDEAIAEADRFQRTVTRDAGLEYLVGLAHRMQGDTGGAEEHFRAALALDADRKDAWSDLGEILLADKRLDEAEVAFRNVDRLVANGRYAWIGPFRLAEIAAWRHDAPSFEEHLREALRRGFTFRTIERDPNWAGFYADPALRDSLDKLITVYGDQRIRESLRAVEEEHAVQ